MKAGILFQVRIISDDKEFNFLCDEIYSAFGGSSFEFYFSGDLKYRFDSDEIKFYGIEVLSQ